MARRHFVQEALPVVTRECQRQDESDFLRGWSGREELVHSELPGNEMPDG